jgi:lipoate-protein ligase A
MPCAAKTSKSAVIPAPEEGSWPAMVRATGGGGVFVLSNSAPFSVD